MNKTDQYRNNHLLFTGHTHVCYLKLNLVMFLSDIYLTWWKKNDIIRQIFPISYKEMDKLPKYIFM